MAVVFMIADMEHNNYDTAVMLSVVKPGGVAKATVESSCYQRECEMSQGKTTCRVSHYGCSHFAEWRSSAFDDMPDPSADIEREVDMDLRNPLSTMQVLHHMEHIFGATVHDDASDDKDTDEDEHTSPEGSVEAPEHDLPTDDAEMTPKQKKQLEQLKAIKKQVNTEMKEAEEKMKHMKPKEKEEYKKKLAEKIKKQLKPVIKMLKDALKAAFKKMAGQVPGHLAPLPGGDNTPQGGAQGWKVRVAGGPSAPDTERVQSECVEKTCAAKNGQTMVCQEQQIPCGSTGGSPFGGESPFGGRASQGGEAASSESAADAVKQLRKMLQGKAVGQDAEDSGQERQVHNSHADWEKEFGPKQGPEGKGKASDSNGIVVAQGAANQMVHQSQKRYQKLGKEIRSPKKQSAKPVDWGLQEMFKVAGASIAA